MKKKKALKRKSRRKVNREMGKAGIPAKKKSNEERVILEPPISVIFIDNTKNGTLPKMLQETEKRLGGMTSFRVRVAESAGMARSILLPSTNPWGPGDCGRQDCIMCCQQDKQQQDCRKRNILYENRCQVCMIEVKDDGVGVSQDGKGVYVGETSHQIKHWPDHFYLWRPTHETDSGVSRSQGLNILAAGSLDYG